MTISSQATARASSLRMSTLSIETPSSSRQPASLDRDGTFDESDGVDYSPLPASRLSLTRSGTVNWHDRRGPHQTLTIPQTPDLMNIDETTSIGNLRSMADSDDILLKTLLPQNLERMEDIESASASLHEHEPTLLDRVPFDGFGPLSSRESSLFHAR